MFPKSIQLICIVVNLVFVATALHAEQVADRLALRDVPPTVAAIESTAKRIVAARCDTPECLAMVTVNRMLDVEMDAMVTTNGVPRPIPPNRDQIAETRRHALLLDHPKRFAAVCTTLKNLASRYGLPDANGDMFVAVTLVNLAMRMDARDDGRCVPGVLAALPRSPKADAAISNAHTICVNRRVRGDDCSRISH